MGNGGRVLRGPADLLRRRLMRFLRALMNSEKNCLWVYGVGTVSWNMTLTEGYSANIWRSRAGVMLTLTLPVRASTGASSTPSSFEGRPTFCLSVCTLTARTSAFLLDQNSPSVMWPGATSLQPRCARRPERLTTSKRWPPAWGA